MLIVLLIGMPIVWVNIVLQSKISIWSIRFYIRKCSQAKVYFKESGPLFGVITILMFGNFIQIALWAGLFRLLGEFPDVDTAIYHSAVNFATLGYGDIVMSPKWRLLGPIEAVNGALMIGLSGATMLALMQNQLKHLFETQE